MLTIKQRLDQHFIPTHFEEILLSFFIFFKSVQDINQDFDQGVQVKPQKVTLKLRPG